MEGKITVALICVVFCINTAYGGIGFGRCPERNVIQQFDLPKYMGRWFEISSFGAFFEFNGKCVQAVYTAQQNGSVEVVNAMIDKSTLKVRHIKGTAVPEDQLGDGKLSVTFPVGWMNRTGPYWVLDTDYENYSVVYACRDFLVAHYEFGWILSRRPTLEQQYMTKVDSVITANGLRPSQFTAMTQNCGVIDCSNEPCEIIPQ